MVAVVERTLFKTAEFSGGQPLVIRLLINEPDMALGRVTA
jgi:hypothetical protein